MGKAASMRTDTWTIEGGAPLRGEVRVSGAKNSITKLMVASMLTSEPCIFHNTPHIGDSQITRAICEALGAEFTPRGLSPARRARGGTRGSVQYQSRTIVWCRNCPPLSQRDHD